jgi:hypothetical protein
MAYRFSDQRAVVDDEQSERHGSSSRLSTFAPRA